jgi:hypothetical protein
MVEAAAMQIAAASSIYAQGTIRSVSGTGAAAAKTSRKSAWLA